MGRVMVNVTDPNTYPPGGRTWAIAFVGTAGDIPLLAADGAGLLPSPSAFSRATTDNDVRSDDMEEGDVSVAYWPTDSASVTVSETLRGESSAAAAPEGHGTASGTVDVAFDVDGDGISSGDEVVTVAVGANSSEVQAAFRALGGLLEEVEVAIEDGGIPRARNGGEKKEEEEIQLPIVDSCDSTHMHPYHL